jgi:hypothetical protein
MQNELQTMRKFQIAFVALEQTILGTMAALEHVRIFEDASDIAAAKIPILEHHLRLYVIGRS